MIELPEAVTIASQMNEALAGKTFQSFARGSLQHKFLWLNRSDEALDAAITGKQVTGASSYGRSIYLHMGKEHLLWFGETGGRILYHAAGEAIPEKVHLKWGFTDGSHLTFALQMWGFVRLLDALEFSERPHAEVGISALSADLTYERFDQLLEAYPEKTKKGVKGFLVTSVHVNGIGNSYLQDILYRARIHPTRKIPDIREQERRQLHEAMRRTLQQAVELGGREDERGLYNQPGRYKRLMDSSSVGAPCSVCGKTIEKIAYLGGACYLCPGCQLK
ncbi:MAG: hypothetical protein JW726_18815 [Anaerolineales bacterium]|nr:hypothetical protein [Anaerolineales bacterium]